MAPARDGAARDGAARDGAARDGAARGGAARDGAGRGGAWGVGAQQRGVLMAWLRLATVLAPAVLLLIAALRNGSQVGLWLTLGTLAQLIMAGLVCLCYRSWAPPASSSVLTCHILALAWLWLTVPRPEMDWYLLLVQAVLIVLPLGVIATFTLRQSGALLVRRAQLLAQQLARRRDWPAQLQDCRDLPEVKALREAMQFDATPALRLLQHRSLQVRLCALLALEFRKQWRPGQADAIVPFLKSDNPLELRKAAVLALANLDDRVLVEVLTESLRDADAQVRRAAADALFWNADRRWSWIRYGVRRAMSDAALKNDPPLLKQGQRLEPEAVNDVTAWAAEKGVLSVRAAQMLVIHYGTMLTFDPDDTLPKLRQIVLDPHAPPLLRIELARLLFENQAVDPAMTEVLLDAAHPAPLRLLAAEDLLKEGPHVKAIVCLREIARLPNRELALATAEVVQRTLGVDLGLALGQPLPALNHPRTVEITRRLMTWAAQPDQAESVLDSQFSLSGSRLPALEVTGSGSRPVIR